MIGSKRSGLVRRGLWYGGERVSWIPQRQLASFPWQWGVSRAWMSGIITQNILFIIILPRSRKGSANTPPMAVNIAAVLTVTITSRVVLFAAIAFFLICSARRSNILLSVNIESHTSCIREIALVNCSYSGATASLKVFICIFNELTADCTAPESSGGCGGIAVPGRLVRPIIIPLTNNAASNGNNGSINKMSISSTLSVTNHSSLVAKIIKASVTFVVAKCARRCNSGMRLSSRQRITCGTSKDPKIAAFIAILKAGRTHRELP